VSSPGLDDQMHYPEVSGVSVAASSRDDSGIAMVLVVGVSVILFLLATTILVVASYLTMMTRAQEVRLKAVHVADAGLNAYLYELRRDPLYWVDHPVLGPTVQDDGSWVVTATAPTTTDALILRAEGSSGSSPASVTVVATVRFPTFADYMFLSGTDINIGLGAVITGKVRSNGNVDNDGEIMGATYAVGRITGSGTFGTALPLGSQTMFPGDAEIDFGQVSRDTQAMREAAVAAGSYLDASGSLGYRITITGTTYTAQKVIAVMSNRYLSLDGTVITRTIPPVGVIYVLGDAWVSGTYSTPVTVCGSNDIYVPDNYRPADMNSRVTAGLIAGRSIIVPTYYDSVPDSMTLTAALLAETGQVYGDLSMDHLHSHMTINGSIAYSTYSWFVLSDLSRGWRTRTYAYDRRLDLYPPPRFPIVHEGSLKVNTWMEN